MNAEELKRLEEAIVQGLRGAESSPVWQSVQQAIDYQLTAPGSGALDVALAPGQTAEQRAYNHGRGAMLVDLKDFLAEKVEKAKRPPAKE